MLSIACVYRTGGVYDWSWVSRLERGVARNMAAPYRFVCLTNAPEPPPGLTTIRLLHDWPGYWSKIELFRPGLFSGPALYLDLDSIITGPVAPLVRAGGFWMVRDFLNVAKGWKNSCVMAWAGDRSAIYEAMTRDPDGIIRRYRSLPDGRFTDQAFIEDMAPDARCFPEPLVQSYKVAAQAAPPVGASVIQFHGRPKPDQIKTGWVADAWR